MAIDCISLYYLLQAGGVHMVAKERAPDIAGYTVICSVCHFDIMLHTNHILL